MKTSILFVCLISCCCINAVNAQWYSNKFGVENINELSNEQLMECYSNARISSISGGVFTGTGIGLILGGLATATVNATEDFLMYFSYYPNEAPSNRSYGGGLIISGLVFTIGGAALWISGGSRKELLRPILKSRGLISDISIHAGADYELLTDTYYPTLTFRIKF